MSALPQPAPAGRDAEMSLINLAARQRMLSQRIVLQTVLAARGSESQLKAARTTLALFTDSQARLVHTDHELKPAQARLVREVYLGAQGVAPQIDAFVRQVGSVLDLAEARSARAEDALATLVASTDAVLAALNSATTVFDRIARTQAEALMRELSGIVGSIQTVAREAKVVSFNAQVMAARAGQHGREFAVVANALSRITQEIDGLSLQAVALTKRAR